MGIYQRKSNWYYKHKIDRSLGRDTELANFVMHALCGLMFVCLRTPRETKASLENNVETHVADILLVFDDYSLMF